MLFDSQKISRKGLPLVLDVDKVGILVIDSGVLLSRQEELKKTGFDVRIAMFYIYLPLSLTYLNNSITFSGGTSACK